MTIHPLSLMLGLLPVISFLAALVFIDSYKLIRPSAVALTILAGGISALAAVVVNTTAQDQAVVEWKIFTRYIAPVIEELLKAVYLVFLFRRNRIGFMVDAAIRGFAIGAGFALVENIVYYIARPDAVLSLWLIRGFGTAMMHGGTTSIIGIIASNLQERFPERTWVVFFPGFAGAVVIHSLYNHFFFSPLVSAILVITVFPVIITAVFRESEDATRRWLGVGFDSDQSLLEMISSGEVSETRIGRYFQALQNRFPGEMVVDMLCYVRLHLELSIRAKGLLMMREAGFEVPSDPEDEAQFKELQYLEGTIGATGQLALKPILHRRAKDLWQITMLKHNSSP
jgi:RsiW-degrading membrane proteinase PrsW (M82 family)